jgi:hypothetical protein
MEVEDCTSCVARFRWIDSCHQDLWRGHRYMHATNRSTSLPSLSHVTNTYLRPYFPRLVLGLCLQRGSTAASQRCFRQFLLFDNVAKHQDVSSTVKRLMTEGVAFDGEKGEWVWSESKTFDVRRGDGFRMLMQSCQEDRAMGPRWIKSEGAFSVDLKGETSG